MKHSQPCWQIHTRMYQMWLRQPSLPEKMNHFRNRGALFAQKTLKLRPFSCVQRSTARVTEAVMGSWISLQRSCRTRCSLRRVRVCSMRGVSSGYQQFLIWHRGAEDSCRPQLCTAVWRKSKHPTLHFLSERCSALCRRKHVCRILDLQVRLSNSVLLFWMCIYSIKDSLQTCVQTNIKSAWLK